MAVLKVNLMSNVLGFTTSFNALLPDSIKAGEKVPVLYLLHGLSDDHNAWIYRTSIEYYTLRKKIAVIMPEVQKSFYTDMYYGDSYYTYISKELPDTVQKFFPVDTERSYIAGLSMGGYGALKIALSNPENYKAVAAFSGVVDMVTYVQDFVEYRKKMFECLFGPELNVKNTKHDLFYLMDILKDIKPAIYLACGTQDPFYAANRRFKEHCVSSGISFDYHEENAGHTWDFWDRQIKGFLDFIGV